jgi:hypothetical protein
LSLLSSLLTKGTKFNTILHMKTYFLTFKRNGNAIFVNELNKKDKIDARDLLRFNTAWTGKSEQYKDIEGYFEGCNCFRQNSYSIDFYRLSECGEQLTNF